MAKSSATFEKGKGGKGRPPGSPNKFTSNVREAVLAAFQEMQNDPDHNLLEWGKKSPDEFYRLSSRLIPTEVTGKIKNIIVVKSDEDDEE